MGFEAGARQWSSINPLSCINLAWRMPNPQDSNSESLNLQSSLRRRYIHTVRLRPRIIVKCCYCVQSNLTLWLHIVCRRSTQGTSRWYVTQSQRRRWDQECRPRNCRSWWRVRKAFAVTRRCKTLLWFGYVRWYSYSTRVDVDSEGVTYPPSGFLEIQVVFILHPLTISLAHKGSGFQTGPSSAYVKRK